MKKIEEIFSLAKGAVTDPAGTAAALAGPGPGTAAPLIIFLCSSAGYAFLLYLEPAGFPSDLAAAAAEFSGRSWAWLFLVQSIAGLAFSAAFCAFFPALSSLLNGPSVGSGPRPGRLFLRTLAAGCLCAVYASAAFYFRSRPLLSLPFFAGAGFAAYLSLRAEPRRALAFFRFVLAASAVELVCLPAAFPAMLWRSEESFILVLTAAALWTFVLTVKAAKELYGGTTVRAALAFLFSTASVMVSFYILKDLGLIPAWLFRFMLFM